MQNANINIPKVDMAGKACEFFLKHKQSNLIFTSTTPKRASETLGVVH